MPVVRGAAHRASQPTVFVHPVVLLRPLRRQWLGGTPHNRHLVEIVRDRIHLSSRVKPIQLRPSKRRSSDAPHRPAAPRAGPAADRWPTAPAQRPGRGCHSPESSRVPAPVNQPGPPYLAPARLQRGISYPGQPTIVHARRRRMSCTSSPESGTALGLNCALALLFAGAVVPLLAARRRRLLQLRHRLDQCLPVLARHCGLIHLPGSGSWGGRRMGGTKHGSEWRESHDTRAATGV
jgi:hypothetical protein